MWENLLSTLRGLLGCSFLLAIVAGVIYLLDALNRPPEIPKPTQISLKELGDVADKWFALGQQKNRTSLQIEEERRSLLAKSNDWKLEASGIVVDVRSSYDSSRLEEYKDIVVVDVICRMSRNGVDFEMTLSVVPPVLYYSGFGQSRDRLLELRKGQRVTVSSRDCLWALSADPKHCRTKIEGHVTGAEG